ncbi:hypothetical protein CapIbe_017979 [Capra ibex]
MLLRPEWLPGTSLHSRWDGPTDYLQGYCVSDICVFQYVRFSGFFNSCRKTKKTHRQISKIARLIYKQGGNRTLNSAPPKTAVDGKQFGKRPPRLSESACLVRPPTQKPTAECVRGEHVAALPSLPPSHPSVSSLKAGAGCCGRGPGHDGRFIALPDRTTEESGLSLQGCLWLWVSRLCQAWPLEAGRHPRVLASSVLLGNV